MRSANTKELKSDNKKQSKAVPLHVMVAIGGEEV
jgi:hypothetical protein